MADTREETTVDNTGNRVEETTPKKRVSEPGFEGFQIFYEKNKNLVNYVGGGFLLLIAALVYFKLFYLPEQEVMASNEIYHAQKYFEADSFRLAVNGGAMVMAPEGQKQMLGFLQIADEYGMTKTGNLAHYYAGVSYLQMGQFEQAIEHLEKYDGNDEILAAVAIGAIGDSHMELNRLEEAVKYYMKAADKRENSFTSPLYLRKAAFAQELLKDYRASASTYERIKMEFPSSAEGREIDLDIARVKALGDLN